MQIGGDLEHIFSYFYPAFETISPFFTQYILMKYLVCLCCWLGAWGLFAQTDSIHTQVDRPPLFDGCDDPLISEKQRLACGQKAFQTFLDKNLQYPDSAKSKGTEGVVIVRFVVDETGMVSQLELLRDVPDGCGKEALRVVRALPNFSPALKMGKPVSAYMTLPIRFRNNNLNQSPQDALYKLHWATAYGDTLYKSELEKLVPLAFEARDYYGEPLPIRDLEITYIYKQKVQAERISSDKFSHKMQKLALKAKSGGVLVVRAHIQKNEYEQVELLREWFIK